MKFGFNIKKLYLFIGRGDLAISIAKEFNDCFVTVIDINEPSLE